MNRILALGILLTAATPAAADDFEWRKYSDQKLLLGGFDNLARFCVESFGFTRVPKETDDVLRGKLEAHLLLANDGDHLVRTWAGIMHETHALDEARKDKALAERGADALIAALSDTDAYSKAEALYLTTVMRPIEMALTGCKRATGDEFIGMHYLRGTGSAHSFVEGLKRDFADGVAQLRAEQSN